MTRTTQPRRPKHPNTPQARNKLLAWVYSGKSASEYPPPEVLAALESFADLIPGAARRKMGLAEGSDYAGAVRVLRERQGRGEPPRPAHTAED